MVAKLPTERSFGLGVGGVCIGVAAFLWWRGAPTAGLVLLVTGTLLVGFGLVAPAVLRVPNRVWWRVAQAVGWFNTRVLLTDCVFCRGPDTSRCGDAALWSQPAARNRSPDELDPVLDTPQRFAALRTPFLMERLAVGVI